MIDPSDLLKVTTLVTHGSGPGDLCPDGVASALIVHDALPDVRIVWVQYNTEGHRALAPAPGMLFVDMTPHPDRAQEFFDAGTLVLDHHVGHRALVERFVEVGRGVYADEPGVSGAVLAYTEVWRPIRVQRSWGDPRKAANHGLRGMVEDFAALAGIRDTWQKDSALWREACAQAAALLFYPWEDLVEEHLGYLIESGKLQSIGELLLQKKERSDARLIAEAWRFEMGGLRVVCVEQEHPSDIADRLAGEADLVLGWHYRTEGGRLLLQVGCRSRGAFSCLAFAQRYGGGGHLHAAGFTVESSIEGPTVELEDLLRAHLDGRTWLPRVRVVEQKKVRNDG